MPRTAPVMKKPSYGQKTKKPAIMKKPSIMKKPAAGPSTSLPLVKKPAMNLRWDSTSHAPSQAEKECILAYLHAANINPEHVDLRFPILGLEMTL